MLRRRLAAVAAAYAIVSALVLSACVGSASEVPSRPNSTLGSSASADIETSSIVLWVISDHEQAIRAVADQFVAKTGVKFDLVVKDAEQIVNDFIAQAANGLGPDIVVAPHDRIGDMARASAIAPIDLGTAGAEFERIAVQAFTLNDQVYGLPYLIENVALIRNTDLAATAPETWDAALASGRSAEAPFPILIGGDDPDKASVENLYPFQRSFGAPVFATADDGSVDATSIGMGGEAGRSYAAWLDAQAKAGILRLSITNDIAINEFVAGNSPFIVAGPESLDQIKDAGLNYTVDPLPTAGPEPATPIVTVQGFLVNAHSTKQDEVHQFLTDFVATEEAQSDLAAMLNRVPANSVALAAARSDPDLAAFSAIGATGTPAPKIPGSAGLLTEWGTVTSEIVDQQTSDPAGSWDAMVTKVRVEIEPK